MGYLDLELKEMLSELDKSIKADNLQLKEAPQGRLTCVKSHGKGSPQLVKGTGERRKRQLITSNRELQIELARKAMLESEIAYYKKCHDVLDLAHGKLNYLGEFSREKFVMNNFPWFSGSMIKETCEYDKVLDDWEKESYEQISFRTEDKLQITSRGLKVRSKSELLIAELIYKYDLPLRYEHVIEQNGSYQLAADFEIMRKDRKLFYWEHLGLMNNIYYRQRQKRKLHEFIDHGITPWDNLILTYDTGDGKLDTKRIIAEIESRLIL